MVIDKSFKTGGVNDPQSYFVESSTGRFAQILSKQNVGDSGNFARLDRYYGDFNYHRTEHDVFFMEDESRYEKIF